MKYLVSLFVVPVPLNSVLLKIWHYSGAALSFYFMVFAPQVFILRYLRMGQVSFSMYQMSVCRKTNHLTDPDVERITRLVS